MREVLLDSTTYIDLERAARRRRDDWARNTIQNVVDYRTSQGNPFLSIVTVVEILKGLYRDIDPAKAQNFKRLAPGNFQVLGIGMEIGFLASDIIASLELNRQSIGFPDSLIAATAIHHGLTLVTSNSRHFQRVVEAGFIFKIENWRQPRIPLDLD